MEAVFFGGEVPEEALFFPQQYGGIAEEFREGFLAEEFDNNQNGWEVGESADYEAAISDGKYRYQSLDRVQLADINLPSFDLSRDFEIETAFTIQPIDSDENFHGLVWGLRNDPLRFLHCTISNEQRFIAGDYNDEWDNWTVEDRADSISPTASNKLTVRKVGSDLYYFINEKLVFEYGYQAFSLPPNLGFMVSEGAVVEFDYFHLSYLSEP